MHEVSQSESIITGGLRTLYSLKSKLSGGADKTERLRTQANLSNTELCEAQELQITRGKCKACVLGAFIADSAGADLDRLSDATLQSLIGLPEFERNPEFFQNCSKRPERRKSQLSTFANENLPLLQSMVTHGGLDGFHFTQTSYKFLKEYTGKKSELAFRFMAMMEQGVLFPSGVSWNSMQCLVKVPLLVARYAGKPELTRKLEDAIRAHQNTTEALRLGIAAGKILERVVLGTTVMEALSWSQSNGNLDSMSGRLVQTVLQSISIPHSVFVAKTGKSDKLPAAFLTSLHAAATSASYQECIRQTLKAGGTGMCGRAQLAGALLAAENGLESVPEEWKGQVAKYEEYDELAMKLISQRAIISIIYT